MTKTFTVKYTRADDSNAEATRQFEDTPNLGDGLEFDGEGFEVTFVAEGQISEPNNIVWAKSTGFFVE